MNVELGINPPLCWWPQGLDVGTTLQWRRLRLNRAPCRDKSLENLGNEGVAAQLKKARDVKSSFVLTGNKMEKYLMYEFMGLCWSNLRVRRDGQALLARNRGTEPIRDLFLLPEDLPEGKAHFTSTLEGNAVEKRINPVQDGGYFVLVDFRIRLRQSCIEAGLYPQEADCVVQLVTGNEAFFKSKGIKAVYLIPQKEIDAVSRLKLDPQPRILKRVWLMLVWDACSNRGLAPILADEERTFQLMEAIRKSGATSQQIMAALERIEKERQKEQD
jgi:hypothetical protein